MDREFLNYLKSKNWFFGIRREETLFFYSAKYFNREELTKREYKSDFVETILYPAKNDFMIRVFNLEQAKTFHRESEKMVLQNPEIILKKIGEDERLWEGIGVLSEELKRQISADDFKSGSQTFKTLIEKYGLYGTNFFTTFSQGMALEKHKEERQDVPFLEALKKHDTWRNAVAFKEEKLGEVFFEFLTAWLKKEKLNIETQAVFSFLTAKETLSLIDGALRGQEAGEKIETRGKNGYLYLFLRDTECRDLVIEDKETITETAAFFAKLEKEEAVEATLKGQTAFMADNIITGEVVVIKDKEELEKTNPDLSGKILVAVQTTPHFIPYLKNAKAIITDEGGITCHAAIVAREFKIPCVVGVKKATQELTTGDRVEINTQEGVINKI